MNKVTKNARIADLESKLAVMQTQINSLIASTHDSTKRLIALEPDNPFHGKFYEPSEPKPKVLDQSIFNGLSSEYKFAAIDGCTGRAYAYEQKPHIPVGKDYWRVHDGMQHPVDYDYDTSNWQNSLIERKELTGSDLCRAMLERGDKTVLCAVSDDGDFEADAYDAICRVDEDGLFESHCTFWWYVRPVNNQGEPLTAADVGL